MEVNRCPFGGRVDRSFEWAYLCSCRWMYLGGEGLRDSRAGLGLTGPCSCHLQRPGLLGE